MQRIHTSRRSKDLAMLGGLACKSKAQNTSMKLFEGVSKYEKNTNINSDGKLDLAKGKNIHLFKYQVQKYCFFLHMLLLCVMSHVFMSSRKKQLSEHFN